MVDDLVNITFFDMNHVTCKAGIESIIYHHVNRINDIEEFISIRMLVQRNIFCYDNFFDKVNLIRNLIKKNLLFVIAVFFSSENMFLFS